MIVYIDTSVLLKLLVADEEGVEAAQRLWLDADYVVCADIGYVEARAALAAAYRTGRLDKDELAFAKAGLHDLWTQIDRVPMSSTLLAASGDTAEREGLRGYDAVHLTAAIDAEATVMATGDGRLLAAAERNGLDTSGPNPF